MLECFIITHTPKPCDLYNWAMDIYWTLYPIKRQQTFLSNSHEIFMKSYHVLDNQESLNTPEAPKGGPTLSPSLPLCHWCCLEGLGPGTPGELCLERVGFNHRCGPAQPCAPQDSAKIARTNAWKQPFGRFVLLQDTHTRLAPGGVPRVSALHALMLTWVCRNCLEIMYVSASCPVSAQMGLWGPAQFPPV